MLLQKLFLLAVGVLSIFPAVAEVWMPSFFSDGMVLQRGCPISIWGMAAPGEKISVAFNKQRRATVAAEDGWWRIVLASEDASAGPRDLHVSGANEVRFQNVLVGDVWLCAGQSNMELELRKTKFSSKEIAGAKRPLIRQFAVARKVSETPLKDTQGYWQMCTPETAGNFSAVGYYFAKSLTEHTNVPVGLINCAWGGTTIEGWMDIMSTKDGGVACLRMVERWREEQEKYPENLEAWKDASRKWTVASGEARKSGREFAAPKPKKPEGPGSKFTPFGIHNAMVRPLYPASILGVIWYQGESDANAGRHDDYAELFIEMINRWRAGFRQPRLPFYFVQLPGYDKADDGAGLSWARLRETQAKAAALPATGMVVTLDLGEHGRIHPVASKQTIGWRLAALALVKTYGAKGEVCGPAFAGFKQGGRELRIRFTHADGLVLKGTGGFEVAGPDRVFYPADARIDGAEVLLGSDKVKTPVAARYAWSNAPQTSLYNAMGFPAAPFRTDLW